jgi:hypothetical protein
MLVGTLNVYPGRRGFVFFQLDRFGAINCRFDIAFIIDMKSDEIFNSAEFGSVRLDVIGPTSGSGR